MTLTSWGRLPAEPALERWVADRAAEAAAQPAPPARLRQRGRNYGDVGLNGGGALLHTRGLDRFIAFDDATGVLRAARPACCSRKSSTSSCRAAGSWR